MLRRLEEGGASGKRISHPGMCWPGFQRASVGIHSTVARGAEVGDITPDGNRLTLETRSYALQ
jgi:hypothetical protein